MKLHRNDPCMVLFQICLKKSVPCRTLAAMATERKKKNSCHKLQAPELKYFVCSIVQWMFTKFVQIMALGLKLTPSWGSHVLHRNIQGNLKKSSCHKLEALELRYLVCSIDQWASTKFDQIMALGSNLVLGGLHVGKT